VSCLLYCFVLFFFFFFFQAEDGIRDDLVTGVQTCALPIFCRPRCCASCKTSVSNASAATRPCRCTCAFWPPAITTWRSSWPKDEIGRASCRERGEVAEVDVAVK